MARKPCCERKEAEVVNYSLPRPVFSYCPCSLRLFIAAYNQLEHIYVLCVLVLR